MPTNINIKENTNIKVKKTIIPDVSHHDPISSWDAIQQTCSFLITKATEGTKYVDPTLFSFIHACETRHIPYWVYTFLKYDNELEQAKFMVKTCKDKVGKYFIGYILDVERNNEIKGVQEALKWLNKQGYKTMLYTQYSQKDRYKKVIENRGENCAWWEARYGKNEKTYNPKYPAHEGVDLHQFTENGVVNGIRTLVDLNRITGNKPLDWFTIPLKQFSLKDLPEKEPLMALKETAKNPSISPIERKKSHYTGIYPVLPPRRYFELGDGYNWLINWPTQLKRVQQLLNWIDDSTEDLVIDGQFGIKTKDKVIVVQEQLDVPITGKFDKATLTACKKYVK